MAPLLGCESPAAPQSYPRQFFAGRNPDQKPIYQTIVPSHWQRLPTESDLEDTMKPICAYCIANEIQLVVHNFPSDTLSQRIPPQAQVTRWQRQFGQGSLSEECYNGFVGLRLEAQNLIAWAMQMDPELFLTLTGPLAFPQDRERRSDYTIKVTGPQDLLEDHRQELETFARYFELIEPIATDS